MKDMAVGITAILAIFDKLVQNLNDIALWSSRPTTLSFLTGDASALIYR